MSVDWMPLKSTGTRTMLLCLVFSADPDTYWGVQEWSICGWLITLPFLFLLNWFQSCSVLCVYFVGWILETLAVLFLDFICMFSWQALTTKKMLLLFLLPTFQRVGLNKCLTVEEKQIKGGLQCTERAVV